MQKRLLSLFLLMLPLVFGIIFTSHLVHAASPAQVTLTVDAGTTIAPFSHDDLGQNYVNFITGRLLNNSDNHLPAADKIPGLLQATNAIGPGIIRVMASADKIGWTRQNFDQNGAQYKTWQSTEFPSSFQYGMRYYPKLLDQIVANARLLHAKVLLTINIVDNNPPMWEDMLLYAKAKGYLDTLLYWEIGNEPNPSNSTHLTSQEYGTRFEAYEKALLAVDASVQFVGPTMGDVQERLPDGTFTQNISPFFAATAQAAKNAGKDLQTATLHWYTLCHTNPQTQTQIDSVLAYEIFANGSPLDPKERNNEKSRRYADIFPNRVRTEEFPTIPGIQLFVDETNIDGCAPAGQRPNILDGNFIGALWDADTIGRLAYNKVNAIMHYSGYGALTENLSLIYPDDPNSPTKVFLRAPYYTYLMYATWFGNSLVKSTTSDTKVSIWASKDSAHPTQVKLMVTNTSGDDLVTTIATNNFGTLQSATYYQLINSHPTDVSAQSDTDNGWTTINGKTLSAMDVAGSLARITPQSISVSANNITLTLPKYSVTSVILDTTASQNTTALATVHIPEVGRNMPPMHPTRSMHTEVFDSSNKKIADTTTVVPFSSFDATTGTGVFTGTVDFGTSLPTGTYTIQVTIPGFVRKQLAAVMLTAGTTTQLPAITVVGGDINEDNVLDLLDYTAIIGCYGNKATTTSCSHKDLADINDDGVIDGVDVNIFLRNLAL